MATTSSALVEMEVKRNLYDLTVSAIKGSTDWKTTEKYLLQHPEQAKYSDEYGLYVLHKVVLMSAKYSVSIPHKFIEHLVYTFPAAMTSQDFFERLPLHHSVGRSTKCIKDVKLFAFLLSRSRTPSVETLEEALNMSSSRMKDYPIIPRHIIQGEILSYLGTPLLFEDSYGDNLLHLMIRNHAPISFIDAYVKAAPDAIKSRTYHEDSVIHTALRSDSSFELIKFLIGLSPELLESTDHQGNTPMHCSIIYGASISTMQMIASTYPPALWMKNEEGRNPKTMLKSYGIISNFE